jgi:hypothetical protein|nr:MAG TPA: PcfJ-like protein [Caudoviricetes sp.]
MKPRTKLEKRILELGKKLPGISEAKKRWAFGLFPVEGFYLKKGEVWCQCCGHVDQVSKSILAVSLGVDEHTCPNCGKSLKLIHSTSRTSQILLRRVSFLQAFFGFNVIRTFEFSRQNEGKGKPTMYDMNEIFQNWITDNGKEVIACRPYTRSVWNIHWNMADMQIGRHNGSSTGYYQFGDLFDTDGNYFYPICKTTPRVVRNGWRNEFIKMNIPVESAIKQLLKNPVAETIVKQGQIEVFKYMLRKGNYQLPYQHALNICHRNGYIIKDASLWFDYLDLLAYFNLDTRNAHYVCPANLKIEHDRLLVRKRRVEERAEIKKKIEEAVKWEREYKESKGKYFGISFSNENIVVSVIQSVSEMAEEGEKMHHCVYTGGYYRKRNSLILSAKDRSGARVETVELSLSTFKVVQSRGVSNSNTAYHNEIVKLVEKNVNLIKMVQ